MKGLYDFPASQKEIPVSPELEAKIQKFEAGIANARQQLRQRKRGNNADHI